ncbi:MAG: hybrid sensor histidine kinase/response regulator [Rariglobus sp.]|jgi:PAS domain S-box-containing protein|nr:hybrid sensor histidine kinase/response regulator [Rariglobus sp.]
MNSGVEKSVTVVTQSAAVKASMPAGLGGLLTEFWARSAVGLCLTDDRGIIVAANLAFAETVGYTIEELSGLHMMRLFAAEASVRGSVEHAAFIAGDDAATAETTYLHKSGRPIFAHASDTRVRTPDGRAYRLTTLVDLSRQVSGVPQLRQHQQAENFTALASDISNDFNNLLSIILGYTAFLQDGTLDSNRLSTAIGGIDHAVRRAANLIRQTLHLSRREELAFQRIAVGDFVKEFYRMAGETLTPGIEVSLDLEGDLPPVSLDPQQFHHVLANLGQKARDLTGEGGRISFATRQVDGAEVRTKFSDAREPSYVMLKLQAEPPAATFVEGERPGTWDAAVRFAERRRDLAVLVVHSIMASHRGHLEIDTWSGPALVFRLYLPALAELVVAPQPPEAVTPAAAAAERTVLVVDDEETLLQALSFLLTRHGFTVIKARDGVEAVEQFARHASRIALVVIDLGLPRMSGWEAFLKIKDHSPLVNAVIMSGHLEANLKTEILRAGAKGYLQKPFAMSEALAEVNRFFKIVT